MLEEDVVDLGRRHAFEGGGEGLHRRSRTSSHILARQEIGLGYDMWQPGPLFGVLQRPGKEGIERLRLMDGNVRRTRFRATIKSVLCCKTYLAGDLGSAEDRDGRWEVYDGAGSHGCGGCFN